MDTSTLIADGSGLVDLLAQGISAVIAARKANDTQAQADALAQLDATLAQVGAAKDAFTAALAANKAQALSDLHERFSGDGSGATGAPVGSKP